MKTILFCFPYAGGSASVYNRWSPYLDQSISLYPVELRARGRRIGEPLYPDLESLVDDVLPVISSHAGKNRYALFGHSMGSLIAYRIAKEIDARNLMPPAHLFLSGRAAPHIKRRNEKKFHLMDDDAFRREVIDLGGTPLELFEHPSLLDIYIPVLKNDFRIVETSSDQIPVRRLPQRLSILLGRNEDITTHEATQWEQYTSSECSFHYFDGGHFFLHEQTREVVAHVNEILTGIQ